MSGGVSDQSAELERLFDEAAAARTAGERARAVERLRAAVALQPRAALSHLMLSLALIEAEAYDQAIDSAEEACRLAPQSAAALYARGRARRLSGDAAAALGDLDQALLLKPINADSHYERALTLVALKRRAEAVEALKAGLVCAPRHKGLKTLARRLSQAG